LSRNKAASLRDLAAKVLDGTVVLSARGLSRESDEQVIARLSAVRGIGPWTAEMFLFSSGLVLLAGRRTVCGGSRQRPDRVGPSRASIRNMRDII
jgi:hypothetical protein